MHLRNCRCSTSEPKGGGHVCHAGFVCDIWTTGTGVRAAVVVTVCSLYLCQRKMFTNSKTQGGATVPIAARIAWRRDMPGRGHWEGVIRSRRALQTPSVVLESPHSTTNMCPLDRKGFPYLPLMSTASSALMIAFTTSVFTPAPLPLLCLPLGHC
jgi:hypothetical protein